MPHRLVVVTSVRNALDHIINLPFLGQDPFTVYLLIVLEKKACQDLTLITISKDGQRDYLQSLRIFVQYLY